MFRRKVHSLERVFWGVAWNFFRENLCGGRWWQMVGYWIRSDLADKEHPNLPMWEAISHGNAFLGQNWGANMHIAATTEHFKCVTESSQSAFCSREVAVALVCSRSVHERVNFRPSSFRIYSGITLIETSLTITSL